MGDLHTRDIIIVVYFIISSVDCEYSYHLSWCEVLQRKGTQLLFLRNRGQDLFWRCSRCCESSHGKRLSITLLHIPRYTLWLNHCCVFWAWVTFHSCHCVQIEDRQEISITKHCGWREVSHWILWSWKRVWNGLTVSVTHKMLELIWRTESLQYIVCSLDVKKWTLERLKYGKNFKGKKKIEWKQETSFIFTCLILSVTLPRSTQSEVQGKYPAYLKSPSGPWPPASSQRSLRHGWGVGCRPDL